MRKNSPLAFSPLIKCFIKHLLTGAFLDTVPQVCFPKLISSLPNDRDFQL